MRGTNYTGKTRKIVMTGEDGYDPKIPRSDVNFNFLIFIVLDMIYSHPSILLFTFFPLVRPPTILVKLTIQQPL